jgi:cytochrome c biogenesis protein CcdA
MNARKLGWASVCVFTVFMLLYFLRLFNIIGSEYDILVDFFSLISLILTTVLVGVIFSAKTRRRGTFIALGLFLVGFVFVLPLVVVLSVSLVKALPFPLEIRPVLAFVLIECYSLGYLAFLFWLNKKKGFIKRWDVDST